jgi:putative aldouronate transport system substrate-binding protein
MRMKKRILPALLAGAMTVSLAACADEGDERPVNTTAPPVTAGGVVGDDGVKTYEYSELKVQVFDRANQGGSDPTNNFYTDWIKEKVKEELNIGVTFVRIGRWTENDDIAKLLAAGDAPDIICSYNENGMIQDFSSKGVIHDLAPYLEAMRDELPYLFDFLDVENGNLIWRNKDPGTGTVYSIMGRRMEIAKSATWIRKDWLDKLGLPLPSTTDEFVDALRAFKQQDPGGVGQNLVPLAMTPDVRWRANTLLDSFIDPNITEKEVYTYMLRNEVNVLFPGYKEATRLLNLMYNEGLIDRDFAETTERGETWSDDKVSNGYVGSLIHNWDQPIRENPGIMSKLLENVPTAELVPIDPFKNSQGKTSKVSYNVPDKHLFIPTTCKNVEGALRYLNWLTKLENRLYLQIGDEGVTHNIVDGVPIMIENVEGPKIMNSPNNIDYTLTINGLDLGDEVLNGMAKASSYPSVKPEVVGQALAAATKDSWMLPDHISVPGGLSVEGPIGASLKEKQDIIFSKSITASVADFDKVWDDLMADYLSSGAQAAMDERARKYDEWASGGG